VAQYTIRDRKDNRPGIQAWQEEQQASVNEALECHFAVEHSRGDNLPLNHDAGAALPIVRRTCNGEQFAFSRLP
jgi:hypothetical protein